MPTATTVPVKMAQRRDTAANWTSINPTLLAGEIGLESDTGYWKVGDGSTAWNSLAYVTGLGGEIPVNRLADGTARQLLQTAANGTDVEWTSNVDVPGTLDVTAAATFDSNVTIQGDLTVNGTTTTIDTTNLAIEDKNIEIGKVATPTDATADGGGITLKGTTDKTINWVDATDAWTFSEHVNIASGKEYRIAGTKVLDATSLGSGVLITSSNITDGTIVDGDINASAAIAGTKISPDFGSQTVTTTGVISAALGAAATPSLTFTGDLNTGIYSPGADQVAISTNGSQRIQIDANGNVGIGGISPSSWGSSWKVLEFTGGNTFGSAGVQAGISQNLYNDGTNWRYKVSAASSFYQLNTGEHIWYNAASGTAGNTASLSERMRLDASGRLGIGTTSFDAGDILHVSGSADTRLKVSTTSTSAGHNAAIRLDATTNGKFTIQTGADTTGGLRFYDNNAGADRVRIDSSGRVGIGTTSPANGRLNVSSTTNQIALDTTDTATYGRLDIGHFTNGTFIGTYAGSNTASDLIRLGTNGTERLRITSAGLVGIGTSSVNSKLHVQDAHTLAADSQIALIENTTTGEPASLAFLAKADNGSGGNKGAIYFDAGAGGGTADNKLQFTAQHQDTITPAMTLDGSGRLGIGTTSPGTVLDIVGSGNPTLTLRGSAVNNSPILNLQAGGSGESVIDATGGSTALRLLISGSERARIDSSGRLLVGTSTARANFFNGALSPGFQLEGTSVTNSSNRFASVVFGDGSSPGPIIALGKHRSSSIGGTTVVASGDEMGQISFQGSDGTEFVEGANIRAEVDGTPGANDMPGRLVFSTTYDGQSSPTERLRIDKDGHMLIGQSASIAPGVGNTQLGASFENTDGGNSRALWVSRSAGIVIGANRNTSDGTIISIRQDGTEEGTISVSGTTVSYNGAHLSRWSQLPGGQEREEILRGTVLSNIDEMCEWGEEGNEQLNRMKVSDVEGDKNVSGVFQAWDDDDDTYINDFYCAMTGDFIIRIAEGVTVERGDLLMSAGDGTAKPQDDDIIRSKTIAKVTSTHVTCTYDDGSYCVPCVLMAC